MQQLDIYFYFSFALYSFFVLPCFLFQFMSMLNYITWIVFCMSVLFPPLVLG